MKQFEIRRERFDVTRDGVWLKPADTNRRFAPGPESYFVDGEEVTRDEYERLWNREREVFSSSFPRQE